MRLWYLVVWVGGLLAGGVSGGKILALFPMPFYSHSHTFLPVLRELSTRGHHITFLSPYPQDPPPPNWTNIGVDRGALDRVTDGVIKNLVNANRYEFFLHLWNMCTALQERVYQEKALQNLLSQEVLDYDLIITEPYFCHESLVGLGERYKIPIVGLFPLALTAWASLFTGNDFLPSYIPDYRTTYSDNMNLLQRIDNTLLAIFQIFSGYYYYLPKQEKLMKRYIYKDAINHPPLVDLLSNVPLHLVDNHYSLGYSRSYQPHTIQIGGLSLKNNAVLPMELKDFMDRSSNGFIYLSFGSHLPVSSLSPSAVEAILMAFKDLDLDVLMKWENETLPNKPSNVKIQKWFPQAHVLGHQKCRIFITHGGLHGLTEAAYNGVPVIGIPFFSDQKFNLKFAEQLGFGYTLLKEDITAENLKTAIKTVLNEKSFRASAVERSLLMRDRPDSAMSSAIFWIEYALRHKDLSHLRPASARLPLYQLYLLDVFAVLLTAILLPLFLLIFLLKRILKSFSKPQVQKYSPKKKTKKT